MGYCFSEIVSWYQKKIGTYDKQPWEKTVEQRILNGFTHVPKKTAKLKTELIDVDLVRGSSFTKVKPKHGIVAVTKFALGRLLLLPAHWRWWCQQTSPRLYSLLLVLYVLELTNVALFAYAAAYLTEDTFERVGASEVVVPGAMMVFLAVLHGEIVSPHATQQSASQNTGGVTRRRHPPPPKRRSRQQPIDKSPPEVTNETASHNSVDNSANKFSKRVRCRRLSFEEGSKRHRRSVAWDVSPIKNKLTLTPDLLCQTQDFETNKKGGGEDDGFESLNSTGSSDHGESSGAALGEVAHQPSPRRASVGYCRLSSGETDHKDSDSDHCVKKSTSQGGRLLVRRRGSQAVEPLLLNNPGGVHPGGESSYQSSDDGEAEGCMLTGGCTTSAAEWMGITTNSEDCSDDSLPTTIADFSEHPFASEFYPSPASAILSPSCASSDKVSCTMWEKREVKKAELSVLDISSAIIARVEAMPENMDYFYGGMVVSVVLGFVPIAYRLIVVSLLTTPPLPSSTSGLIPSTPVCFPFAPELAPCSSFSSYLSETLDSAFGDNIWERSISVIAVIERICLASLFFFLLAVAERTFKQKFLYAKFFSHLTSFRRARKSELPHFRLNKVRNIKTWLSVRSYLKKRGPQHSVDTIVSSVFLITLLLISFLSVELLKDSEKLHSDYNVEALVWCIILGLFLLRFMTLGTKINRKYRNLSVLITEQINLYLQIEQKPNKKDELMVANSVLKLAADLLKELECPYKISGFSANPYLYTITKVVILSALSGVLSELLGFKLKLHKIKIK